ncbi:MAG: hypothetical protein DMG97_36300, partial [Acidobacteria bacterium]
GRWKEGYTPEHLAMLEALVGDTLTELGYPLATTDSGLLKRPHLKRMRTLYQMYFDSKLWLKAETPLGRLFVTKSLSWL